MEQNFGGQEAHVIDFKVQDVPEYTLQLHLNGACSGTAKMTVLLFAIDFAKERTGIADMANPNTTINFDDENLTTTEEILQTKMEEVLIKRDGPTNPFTDVLEKDLKDKDVIMLNNKEQLIRVVKKTKDNGRVIDIHNILSFDVTKLPQSKMHKYIGEAGSVGSLPARAKVPVRDGRSQNKFIQESKLIRNLVENAGSTFYTPEEVAKHKSDDDCWTVYKGIVYDVTEYAKVHPGGRKIFLGKGKDCTELFDKYHPWVNCPALIGKYQVGILKNTQ